jgi:hypothetical protein
MTYVGAKIGADGKVVNGDFTDCEGWPEREDVEGYLAEIGYTPQGDGTWQDAAGERVAIIPIEDHGDDDQRREAQYAAEAVDMCQLCGGPCAPVEKGVHHDCAHREQYLADRAA